MKSGEGHCCKLTAVGYLCARRPGQRWRGEGSDGPLDYFRRAAVSTRRYLGRFATHETLEFSTAVRPLPRGLSPCETFPCETSTGEKPADSVRRKFLSTIAKDACPVFLVAMSQGT